MLDDFFLMLEITKLKCKICSKQVSSKNNEFNLESKKIDFLLMVFKFKRIITAVNDKSVNCQSTPLV